MENREVYGILISDSKRREWMKSLAQGCIVMHSDSNKWPLRTCNTGLYREILRKAILGMHADNLSEFERNGRVRLLTNFDADEIADFLLVEVEGEVAFTEEPFEYRRAANG